MPTQKFKIINLTCEACVKLSIRALKKIPGVTNAMVDLSSGASEITADREVAFEEIVATLKSVEKEVAQA